MLLRASGRCYCAFRHSRVGFPSLSRQNSTSVPFSSNVDASLRPRTIFSGIQPTGIPHLGNYLGALSNWVKLQNENPQDKLIFSIVGWHALTLPQNPTELAASRRDMLAVLLAVGLDPKRCVLFHQDSNAMHTELAWILSCITPTGKLRRMTSWKSRLAQSRNANDESEVDESMLNAGLLTYPVLQAADILLYRATHVPVGEDQRQHLELSRDIADSFNRTFRASSRMFPLPTALITPSKRILSLKDPASKMSKSASDPASRILLTDTANQIAAKVRAAVTDSITTGVTYDPVLRPGTSSLLSILAACADEEVDAVASRCTGMSHGELKTEVAAAVDALIAGPRAEFERIRGEVGYLDQVARKGAEAAKELSAQTMVQVRQRVGLN
ncbi:mitochondrial tryptophan--tRNA ligase [Favolaschia claudopus]|uniref:tryptophan--tRNA ligase n=1 Tax=Favolaschia claudopus TaxID=2862362 RepID=A0AAW0CAC3_9AGAR